MTLHQDSRKYHIVVVEDNAADVELIRRALAFAGLNCRLTILDDGAKGIEYARNLSASELPDLAVLDLNLPKSDGIDVLRALRAGGPGARLPVLILSSSPSSLERGRLQPYGIEQYIVKPADLDEYLAIGLVL